MKNRLNCDSHWARLAKHATQVSLFLVLMACGAPGAKAVGFRLPNQDLTAVLIKSHLLGDYAGRPSSDAQIDDPFGGDLDEYRATFERLEALLAEALARLPQNPADANPGDH